MESSRCRKFEVCEGLRRSKVPAGFLEMTNGIVLYLPAESFQILGGPFGT